MLLPRTGPPHRAKAGDGAAQYPRWLSPRLPALTGRTRRGFWLPLVTGFLSVPAMAEAQKAQNPDSVLANEKRVMLTPFLAPGYTPEMGALVSLGALISFRTTPGYKEGSLKELVQRSTITFNGSYSTTQAI